MITEADAARACPQQGFLFQYVLHAMKQTTSPLAYHIGVGLSILAATCPQPYGMRYAGTLRPNMYTLLVGRSGEDQKSSALGIGKEVLFEAAAALCGDFPGSAEGLIESLDRQNTQLITVSEFGKLLAAAQREELKDPCPQSWLMMKMRTDNPAPMIARGTASHHATLQAQIMIAQSKKYEPCEFTTCQNAFPLSGRW